MCIWAQVQDQLSANQEDVQHLPDDLNGLKHEVWPERCNFMPWFPMVRVHSHCECIKDGPMAHLQEFFSTDEASEARLHCNGKCKVEDVKDCHGSVPTVYPRN